MADRVALVTGGARGIGEAITTTLAMSGIEVAAGYARDEEAANRLVKTLTGKG